MEIGITATTINRMDGSVRLCSAFSHAPHSTSISGRSRSKGSSPSRIGGQVIINRRSHHLFYPVGSYPERVAITQPSGCEDTSYLGEKAKIILYPERVESEPHHASPSITRAQPVCPVPSPGVFHVIISLSLLPSSRAHNCNMLCTNPFNEIAKSLFEKSF